MTCHSVVDGATASDIRTDACKELVNMVCRPLGRTLSTTGAGQSYGDT